MPPRREPRARRRAARPILGSLAVAALTVSTLLPAAACCRAPSPDPDAVAWHTWTNDDLGYAIDYPQSLRPRRQGDDEVAFRQGLFAVRARVVWVSEEEGRRRGLWPGHPAVGEGELAGRPATRFDYEHGDGPFVSRTLSWVIPYRGKLLALELRCTGEPDAAQRRMLESFRLL